MAIIQLFIEILWVGWLIYWFISARSVKKSVHNNAWWQFIGFRIVFVIIVILSNRIPFLKGIVLHLQSASLPMTQAYDVWGAFVCVCGIALAVWARFYLGKNWGTPMTERVSPELVTTGPYAYIRHPIYTGVLLALFGTAFVFGFVWMVVFICTLVYFVYSAKIEEKRMLKHFPGTYSTYQNRTKMFVPNLF